MSKLTIEGPGAHELIEEVSSTLREVYDHATWRRRNPILARRVMQALWRCRALKDELRGSD